MPAVSDTWEWQLTGKLNTSYAVQVYDVDIDTPQTAIDALHAQGRRVVCYFSAGSSENWRADFSQFTPADMGSALNGWSGERYLDTRSDNVRRIMSARFDLARSKKCDGVEPDNVDAYSQPSGLPLTATTQLAYNRFLAEQGHLRGLAVALKNDIDQVAALAPYFDFAVNEQCHEYSECGVYSAFVNAGKAVFNAEYAQKFRLPGIAQDGLCANSRSTQLRTLVLALNLDDSFRHSCD